MVVWWLFLKFFTANTIFGNLEYISLKTKNFCRKKQPNPFSHGQNSTENTPNAQFVWGRDIIAKKRLHRASVVRGAKVSISTFWSFKLEKWTHWFLCKFSCLLKSVSIFSWQKWFYQPARHRDSEAIPTRNSRIRIKQTWLEEQRKSKVL